LAIWFANSTWIYLCLCWQLNFGFAICTIWFANRWYFFLTSFFLF
jgi:hypothetical protein